MSYQESQYRGPRVNQMIRIPRVFLIDEEGNNVGVVEREEALRRADEAGLDLVEISADRNPPLCKILDFGKYKYEQSKKDKANRARSKTAEMKEVRLGRSMKIDPHDIGIRLQQARRFLMDGHKVQIVQNFRGREMIHRERGHQRMRDITEQLDDIAKVETPPRMAGRRMTMIFAPDKTKIERLKREAAATSDGQATDAGPAPEETPVETPASEEATVASETPVETPPSEEATVASETPVEEIKAES
ncbi:MAG: translation initiation factor IF-3 [Planctomycetota bacterium]